MVTLAQLWLPILLSAVFVFVASSLIHMVLKWHNPDYKGLPNEEEVRAGIRKGSPAPGMYVIPRCENMKDLGKPEMVEKFQEGPVGFLILRANGAPNLGKSLVQWFLYCAVISLFAAYLAAHTLEPGSNYIRVFRIVGTVSFMAHAGGSIPMGIWWGQPWRSVSKGILDGLIYSLVMAGTFGWLWPH